MRRFELPPSLVATAPAPTRAAVRLLVARPDGVVHSSFDHLGGFLEAGDLVVVNTSATLAAAVDGRRGDGRAVTVHFAAELDDGDWVVEIRPAGRASGPVPDVRAGELITLADEVRLTVGVPHPADQTRLWRATVTVEGGVIAYLSRRGRPIRYAYLSAALPLADYQTVFARHPGSAEMPSAGRPFTHELVTDLITRGVSVAPITLHTGVSSQEPGEPPQPERFRVPETTARAVNMTRAWGGRVIAVGTTVTRALETSADSHGISRAGAGWTDVVLGPQREVRVVGGLITGWHESGTSHVQLLEAVAGPDLVESAYAAALRARYRWHEFGDSCLLLP